MDVLDRAIRHQESMFKIETLALLRILERLPHQGQIFRVRALEDVIDSRFGVSIVPKDPKSLIRPNQFTGRKIPTKAARVTERLSLVHIDLAPPEFLERVFLLSDIQRIADQSRDFTILEYRLARAMHRSVAIFTMTDAILNIAANAFRKHFLDQVC